MTEFSVKSVEDWRALAEKALKGSPFESLETELKCGLTLKPLETGADDPVVIPRSRRDSRVYFERIDHPAGSAAKDAVKEALAGGADALDLVFEDAGHAALGFGLPLGFAGELADELSNHRTGAVRIEAGARSAALALDTARKIPDTQVVCALPVPAFYPDQVNIGALRGADNISGVFAADGRRWHNAGADEVLELALVLSECADALHALDGAALLDAFPAPVSVTLSTDSSQFAVIAKIRAARLLFARMMEVSGLPYPLHIHAETSWRMMSRPDPFVNMLRTTTAAFSAITGGADSLSILPFTRALGLSDGFAARMARNTFAMLVSESHTDHVDDPAAGSGSLEKLTHDMAAAAWELFRALEKDGGLRKGLQNGAISARVKASGKTVTAGFLNGDEKLVGVNAFPDPERRVPRITTAMTATPMALPDLPLLRFSEAFEDTGQGEEG